MIRLALAILALLSACAAPPAAPTVTPTVGPLPTPASAPGWPRTLTDGTGRQITLAAPPQRIISYLPSNTETLFAIGAGDRIVGVDNFSDIPAAAKALPKVGDLKPNAEAIAALKPDLVVVAGRSPDLPTLLAPLNVPVFVVEYKDLAGTLDNFRLLGKLTGNEAQADQVAREVAARIDAVKAKTAGAPRPRVYYEVDASDPSKPFTIGPGSFVDGLITIAGGANVAADASSQFPQLSAEAIVAKDPEVILLGAPGDDLVGKIRARPGWANVTAVKTGAVRAVDGSTLSRPGPRIVDAVDELARAIHPELFQ